jgi:hypothetical protein
MTPEQLAITVAVIAAAAAIIQAGTAVVIVFLTRRLASLASGSLEQSERQVAAAHAATDQVRIQGLLAAVPMLRVERPLPEIHDDGELYVRVLIENGSDQPALAVEATIYALTNERRQERNARATSMQIPVMPVGGSETLTLLGREVRNIPNPRPARADDYGQPVHDPEEYLFSNDWLLIVVEWRSILNASVSLAFEWAANSPEYEHGWRLRAATIKPDPASADQIVVPA